VLSMSRSPTSHKCSKTGLHACHNIFSVDPTKTMMTGCHHGSAHEHFQWGYQRLLDAFLAEYSIAIAALSSSKPNADAYHRVLEQFRSRRHALVFANDEMVNYIFAWSTTQMLSRNEEKARLGTTMGLFLCHKILPQRRREKTEEATNNDRKFSKYMRLSMTKGGLFMCIDDHVPCSCLDQHASATRSEQCTGTCYGCNRDFPRDQLSVCGQCNTARYCTRACQLQNW
jgi:hypothetical protein